MSYKPNKKGGAVFVRIVEYTFAFIVLLVLIWGAFNAAGTGWASAYGIGVVLLLIAFLHDWQK